MAAYVIVCILFVFFALIVYAVILHKKKKQGLKVRRIKLTMSVLPNMALSGQ